MISKPNLIIALSCSLALSAVTLFAQNPNPDPNVEYFDKTIAPILAANCLDCHSAHEPKAKLNLQNHKQAMAGSEKGPVIKPGQPDKSVLWDVITFDDMPPKHPLSDQDKKTIYKWLADGAKWGTDPINRFQFSSSKRAGYDWWSLQPLHPVKIPNTSQEANPDSKPWPINNIDHFILARLHANNLKPSPIADPRTRIRRLYIDLIGLPAPIDVIEQFTQNPSQKHWEQIVDKLLASKHYGERWTRHWMDIARFGESSGFEYNTPRETAWHYRDWLIRAFNTDMPYDEFARMQLAGDIIKPNTVNGLSAVGFLVAGVHNEVLGVDPKMKMTGRQNELEEIVSTVGQAFLGMTIHCARCHDHKFDPISTREYYQFIAALDGVHHGERQIQINHPAVSSIDNDLKQLIQLHKQLTDSVVSRKGILSNTANVVTTKQAFAANENNQPYSLSFKLAPTVWAGPSQATTQGDGIIVRIIQHDNQVLTSRHFENTAWDQAQHANTYRQMVLSYTGNGSGPIKIQIQPYPLHVERFGGAIDDLELKHQDKIIFKDNFDDFNHTQPPSNQAHTQRKVYHSSQSKRWDHFGINTMHLVEHADNNYALQLFGGSSQDATILADTGDEPQLKQRIAAINQKINKAREAANVKIYTVVSKQPPIMRVHHRGSVETLGDEVSPGGLIAVQSLSPSFNIAKTASDAERRLRLAQWVTAEGNSLFGRVGVNRIWHYHFGAGLVQSPNDFGFNGGQPSHPELLDWLTTWFKDNGYSMKKLHRLIVTSATYQQSSKAQANATYQQANDTDKSNRLLWRQNPRRVEGEVLRDSVLAIAGELNTRMYGPGFKDVQINQNPPTYYYRAIDPIGPEFNRRTIYRWQPRGQRNSLLDTFDCPDPSVITPRRYVTTTPTQALSQWNHPFMLRMADIIAERVKQKSQTKVDEQIKQMWIMVLRRSPGNDEIIESRTVVNEQGLATLARVLLNSNELIWIE